MPALLLGLILIAMPPAQAEAAQLALQNPPPAQVETAPVKSKPASPPAAKPAVIRFDDATDSSGIHFTHSMGSQALGSLLEATGGGCVWFDYNNDGLLDLYVVSGKPLEDSMHPHPMKVKPDPPPHNHLYRNNGDGTFTDVTDQAGVAPDMYSIAVTAADFDNDGFVDLLVTGFGKVVLYAGEHQIIGIVAGRANGAGHSADGQ